MKAAVSAQSGASRCERAEGRTVHRNGYREREGATRTGSLSLAIPKLRAGAWFPSFLDPDRRAELRILSPR
jgi:transposase-like protein